MIKSLIALSLLLFSINCGTETDTGTLGTITGWVVDAGKKGVNGAEVILRDTGSFSDTTTTFATGNFRFEEVKFGNYYIEINAHDSLGALVEATVSKDKQVQEIDSVTIKEFSTIKGSINDSLASSGASFIYIIALDRKVPVDSLGRFLISHVPESDYAIRLIEGTTITPSPLDTIVISVAAKDTVEAFNLGTPTGDLTIQGAVHE